MGVNSHIPNFRLEFSTPKNLWISHKAVTQHIATGVDSWKLLRWCHKPLRLLADWSLAIYSRDRQLLYRGQCIPKEVLWADQTQPCLCTWFLETFQTQSAQSFLFLSLSKQQREAMLAIWFTWLRLDTTGPWATTCHWAGTWQSWSMSAVLAGCP